MKISTIINDFIAYKRASGALYRCEEYTLRAFCKSFHGYDITSITTEDVKKFIFDKSHNKHNRYGHLRVFWRFAVEQNYISSSPMPTAKPKPQISLEPYIYSREELKRLFAAARLITRKNDPLFAFAIQTILILLYGAALRLNEALSLKGSDVNIDDNILTIRETKFFKSRLVPISPRLSEVLQSYIKERTRWHHPVDSKGYFFVTTKHSRLLNQLVRYHFKKLCKRLKIQRTDGSLFKPRLHDLRHTFARHRLLAGYRNKEDLQSLVVGLSIYLGHSELKNTQRYMTLATELLADACQQFESYALEEVSHVH